MSWPRTQANTGQSNGALCLRARSRWSSHGEKWVGRRSNHRKFQAKLCRHRGPLGTIPFDRRLSVRSFQSGCKVRHRDIIVIGASLGGVEALRRLVGALPPKLPAAVFVVLHIPPDSPGYLAAILADAGPLPTTAAVDGVS